MIRRIAIIAFALLTALLQVSFINQFSITRTCLNLAIIFVGIITLFTNIKTSLLFATVSGIVLGVYSPFAFGTELIALYGIILFMHYLMSKMIARRTIYAHCVVIFISTFVYYCLVYIVTYLLFWFNRYLYPIPLSRTFFSIILSQMIIHVVFFVCVYYIKTSIVRRIQKIFFLREYQKI